jgi:hypothetical protein
MSTFLKRRRKAEHAATCGWRLYGPPAACTCGPVAAGDLGVGAQPAAGAARERRDPASPGRVAHQAGARGPEPPPRTEAEGADRLIAALRAEVAALQIDLQHQCEANHRNWVARAELAEWNAALRARLAVVEDEREWARAELARREGPCP